MNNYLFFSKSEKVLRSSSSGGAFYHLAKALLNTGKAAIYGTELRRVNEHFENSISRIDNISDIHRIMRSKYVISTFDVKAISKMVLDDLSNKFKVMIAGTPCQLERFRLFISNLIKKDDWDNIFLVSVFCHGVPKKTFFDKYIDELNKKYKNDLVDNINFRYKKESWDDFCISIDFTSGKNIVERQSDNPYFTLFCENYLLLDSCFSCNFKNCQYFDFYLGDFWGITKIGCASNMNKLGNSIVFANTDKATQLINSLFNEQNECFLEHLNDFNYVEYCLKYNSAFLKSVCKPNDYDKISNIACKSIFKAYKTFKRYRLFNKIKTRLFKKR